MGTNIANCTPSIEIDKNCQKHNDPSFADGKNNNKKSNVRVNETFFSDIIMIL